jgi:hypothetical protein
LKRVDNEEAQRIADEAAKVEGVHEVLWLLVFDRMAEFYIVMDNEAAALKAKPKVQGLVNNLGMPTRFAVMDRQALSWGYSAPKTS